MKEELPQTRGPRKIHGIVALCRSRTTGVPFGIRFRKEGGSLVADYSFRLRYTNLAREGFGERIECRGLLDSTDDYPGCPDNKDKSFFKCYCGGLTSWNEGMGDVAQCRWCGYDGPCEDGARDVSNGRDL